MKIAIVKPASAGARSGNQHTAERWARFLRGLGHRVSVATEWNGRPADALIALHARKSHASIASYRDAYPAAPLVVVLTGTDLYRDIGASPEARRSLELASRLVTLQVQGRRELPQEMRRKTRVIYQSADVRIRHEPVQTCFRVAVIGHLREEKDPFRAAAALAHLPDQSQLEVIHVGMALSPDMRKQAREWMKREPRYHWIGSQPHARALRWLARSHLLVVSSVMEGGANVICEAARLAMPVLASRVAGNVGMLGSGYPGYFKLFDDRALARLIERVQRDARFYRILKAGVRRQRPLFAPAAERRALKQLVHDL
jgi:putative glycosyltransferase (TIGR04348 family)